MKFLVFDYGLFATHADKLADKGKNKVWYYTQWESGFPCYDKYIVGEGTEVEKIKYFWDKVDEADCVVNFDVYGNDIIEYLRKKGKRCFGSGKGMMLENDRELMKKLLAKLGLPVNKYEKIIGTTALREYLKTHKDKYIKIDLFRANLESFHSKDYTASEMIIDEMDAVLGPMKDKFPFLVEDAIDAKTSVEPGQDVFFNGKAFVKPYLYGYEIAKAFYIGKFVDKLPPQLQNTLDKMTPVLQKLDYRGAISFEEKVVDKKTSYLLDVSARQPAPLSAGYVEWIKNYPELIYKVAGAEDVEIKSIAKYVGALPLQCGHAKDHWVRILLEDKYRKVVKFRQFVKNKYYYAVPGLDEIVVLIAWGDTIEQVFDRIAKLNDVVDAYGLQKDLTGLEEAREQIEKGKTLGIDF